MPKDWAGGVNFSFRLYHHRHTGKVDGFDQDELLRQGFKFAPPPAAAARACAARNGRATLVHCCCDQGSLLSRPRVEGGPTNFVDITAADDFTSDAGFAKAKAAITGPESTFFYCSPCTGGSAWQRLNLAKAIAKGRWSTVLKILEHRELHWALWARFEEMVNHCLSVGDRVIL